MIYEHDSSALFQSLQVLLMALNFVPYIVFIISKTNIRIWDYFALPDLVTLFRLIIVTVLIRFVIIIPLNQLDIFYKSMEDYNINLFGSTIDLKSLYIVEASKWLLFPVIEEILHRGLILSQFLKRYSPAKAIILSSMLFSFVHLRYEDFAGLLVVGIVLGILYYKTNSILVTSISHCIFNLAGVLLNSAKLELNSGNLFFYICFFAISILIVVLLLRKPMNTIKLNISNTSE
jgi:membrane protease YdiL (CAAX protease family)